MGSKDRIACWLALRSICGIGDVRAVKLAEHFGGAQAVFARSREELRAERVPPQLCDAIAAYPDWSGVDREIERARKAGAELLCLDDPGYPGSLRFISDPPVVLSVRGTVAPEDALAVAVVGSRSASPYGLAVAQALARELRDYGVTVVSGLALGIDGAAHRGALDAGGRTIAVLGSGIDVIYPSEHRRLADQIVERGALVSEFPPGALPWAGNFPRRNRIVAGLSLGVVVVEASERSGSLITARLAAGEGREVCAVPGMAGAERTRGTHRLLRDGAALVESGRDVIEAAAPWLLRDEKNGAHALSAGLPPEKRKLLECFDGAAVHVDRLIERSGFGAARVLEMLLELELAGRVSQHPGMFFSKR